MPDMHQPAGPLDDGVRGAADDERDRSAEREAQPAHQGEVDDSRSQVDRNEAHHRPAADDQGMFQEDRR
jgi:hypothetical protein